MLKAGPNIVPTSPLGEALRLLPGETVHTQANAGADVPKVPPSNSSKPCQNMFLKQRSSRKETKCKSCIWSISVKINVSGGSGFVPRWLYPCWGGSLQVLLCMLSILATLHSVSQVASDSDRLSVCGGRHQQLWRKQAGSWHGKALISFLKNLCLINCDSKYRSSSKQSVISPIDLSHPHNWNLSLCSLPLHYGKIRQIGPHGNILLFLASNLKAQATYCW